MSSARPLSHHSFKTLFSLRHVEGSVMHDSYKMPSSHVGRLSRHAASLVLDVCAANAWLSHTFAWLCLTCMAVPHIFRLCHMRMAVPHISRLCHTYAWLCHMHGCATHMHGCATHMHGCATPMHGCATHMHGDATHMHGGATHMHGGATHMHGCLSLAVCVVTPPSSVSLTSLLVWPRGGELSRSVRSRHVR